MTRHKRRKIKGIIKCAAVVVLPLAVASGVHEVSQLKAAVTGAKVYTIASTGGAEAVREELSSDSVSRLIKQDETLWGSMILSEGYGVEDESEKNTELQRLPDPLDMKAYNEGDKPYPENWETDGDIIRLTY